LCSSRQGHTAQLVESFLLQQQPDANTGGQSPELSYGFWSITIQDSRVKNCKHGLKNGHILRFNRDEKNILIPGIQPGSRYLVTDSQPYSFNICGPILVPISPPLTAESYPDDDAPLVVIRRSAIGR
jgi:hypothetical protein